MKLATKMPLAITALIATSIIALGVIAILSAQSALHRSAEDKLLALVDARAAALSDYLGTITEDLKLLGADSNTQQAMVDFARTFPVLGGEAIARKLYVDDNTHKGKLWDLDDAGDGSDYSRMHASYHPWLRAYAEARGYYDIFLVAPDGDLVYSYTKEPDFGTNLGNGKWKDSGLAQVWRQLNDVNFTNPLAFVDFEVYAPSNGAAGSFIGKRIMRGSQNVGSLIFQMPIGRINSVMQRAEGMGESGETYIVGIDEKMRSDSRFLKPGETSILKQDVKTVTVAAALKGETGVALGEDYRGIEVVSAYKPLEFEGVTWAIIGEVDADEIFAPVAETRNVIMGVGLAALIVAGLVGFFSARSITRPLAALTDIMRVMARGEYNVSVPATSRKDELGDMAHATEQFRDKLIEGRDLARQQSLEQERQIERGRRMETAVSDFDRAIGVVVEGVSAAATQLQSTAQSMSATAEETATQSQVVAAATEEKIGRAHV